MATIAQLILPQGGLPPALLECLDSLTQVASALHLADTRPASLAAAAAAAAADSQAGQDCEAAAFDTARQLSAQLDAAQAALAELQQLAASLDAAAEARQADMARWAEEAEPARQRAAGYATKQRQLRERLAERGMCPEVMQTGLQARSRQHAAVVAELEQVERQLERYQGLPADAAEAAAATQRKRQQLDALRRRLREQLEGLQ